MSGAGAGNANPEAGLALKLLQPGGRFRLAAGTQLNLANVMAVGPMVARVADTGAVNQEVSQQQYMLFLRVLYYFLSQLCDRLFCCQTASFDKQFFQSVRAQHDGWRSIHITSFH